MRSLEGLTRLPFDPRRTEDRFRAVERAWNHPSTVRIRSALNEAGRRRRSGNTRFTRESLFGVHLMAIRLGFTPQEALARIAQEPGYRELFGFERLPSRQAVSDFRDRWLPQSIENLDAIRREAYLELPAQAIAEFNLDTTKIYLDTTVILSANERPREGRNDDGAGWVMRPGQRGNPVPHWGRLKATVMLFGAAPIIIAGRCKHSPSEQTLVGSEILPLLVGYSDAISRLVSQRTGEEHPGYRNAAIAGDNAFANSPMIKAFDEGQWIGAFRPPAPSNRRRAWVLRQDREAITFLAHPQRQPAELEFDVGNDGMFYCPCDRDAELKRRAPMKRESHRRGLSGGFYLECAAPVCAYGRPRLHVSASRPLHRVNGRGAIAGTPEEALEITAALPSGDARTHALNHRGKNVLESHHGNLRRFLLGKRDIRRHRHLFNQPAYDFAYALVDFIWNLDVLEALEQNGVGETISWEVAARGANASAAQVEARRQARDELRERIREEAERQSRHVLAREAAV